jgi:outer membrane receptor protein involved in Fe transport
MFRSGKTLALMVKPTDAPRITAESLATDEVKVHRGGGNLTMLKSRYFCGGSILAAVLTLGLTQAAAAADAAKAEAEVSEVVVTGSYIAGTPEDSALPVDVLSNDVLEKQGSPTAVQLV